MAMYILEIMKIKAYFSLVKFSHSIFALPFATIGFILALYQLQVQQEFQELSIWNIVYKLLLMLLCMVTARSAAMAFNRWLDRDIDAKNIRTNQREIPKGIISPNAALIFCIFQSVIFIIATFFINLLCFYLSFVALFVIFFYSYTKRFTWLCHIILGLGLGLAPIGAYLVLTSSFAVVPILFSVALMFWVSGFDIIYSLQDREFDQKNYLFSVPALFGLQKAKLLAQILHFLCICILTFVGFLLPFGIFYFLGLIIFSCFIIYQYSKIKLQNLSNIDVKYMTLNGWASLIFGLFVVIDILVKLHFYLI